MAKVFSPFEHVLVDASAHGDGYQYRVAVGLENWGTRTVTVCKVQIVNPEGKVLGLQAPSYPTKDEWHKVKVEMDRLTEKYLP